VQTDKEGKAIAANLPIGKYTAVETKTVEGYVLDQTPKTVTVNADETTNVSFVNKKIRGNVQVFKTDEENNPLQGVEFTLYNGNGDKVKSAVSNKKGEVLFEDLGYGNYTIRETKNNEGYVLDNAAHSISINRMEKRKS
ncbi:collagen binding domain-containing protein, partial [Bacillus subtilis]